MLHIEVTQSVIYQEQRVLAVTHLVAQAGSAECRHCLGDIEERKIEYF